MLEVKIKQFFVSKKRTYETKHDIIYIYMCRRVQVLASRYYTAAGLSELAKVLLHFVWLAISTTVAVVEFANLIYDERTNEAWSRMDTLLHQGFSFFELCCSCLSV